jgi:flagellar basal-body rod protein FlgF
MYYGIQLAASGALTSLYRTDVLANNLANLNTTGFKPELAFARERDPARVEDGLWAVPSNELLEKLGAGAHMAPNRVDHAQGNLSTTGNPLDLAIQGEGFFVLRSSADGDTTGIKLTRDGRMTRDGTGRLVNASTGLPVLSVRNRPINLDPGYAVTIDHDGTIRQAGTVVDRVQIINIEDKTELTKEAAGQFGISQRALNRATPASGRVEQGVLEDSAVNPIAAMMGVQSAARAVGTNFTMISYQDKMMERAINTFARIG